MAKEKEEKREGKKRTSGSAAIGMHHGKPGARGEYEPHHAVKHHEGKSGPGPKRDRKSERKRERE